MTDIQEIKDKDLNIVSGGNNDGQHVCPNGLNANIHQDEYNPEIYRCFNQSINQCNNESCPYRDNNQSYNTLHTGMPSVGMSLTTPTHSK